jgi:hypothetical protein
VVDVITTDMAKSDTTESIRIRKHTKHNLAVGFKAPFKCASYAEFLARCEQGEMCAKCKKRLKEVAAWQKAAREEE